MDSQNMQYNDGAFLYVLFTFQFLFVIVGFPLLLWQCSDSEKRATQSRFYWILQMILLCFGTMWLMGTYELVQEQVTVDQTGIFDPYKLLHIANDGSFGTREIKQAYKTLAKKFHPDAVNLDKVPFELAQKRWLNLVKAHETLTKKANFDNYRKYGDPEGSRSQRAMDLAMPSWLVSEEFRFVLILGFFASLVFSILGLGVWTSKNENQNESGIHNNSQISMKEYLLAVLEDNQKGQRHVGLTEQDIVDLYEQTVEVMAFQEELNKKSTFHDIVKDMIKKAKFSDRFAGEAQVTESTENEIELSEEHAVSSLLPRLNETLFEVLGDDPFQGQGMLVSNGTSYTYSGEKLFTNVVAFTLKVLGGKIIPRYKLSFATRVDGEPATEPIRRGDLLTIDVTCERLTHQTESNNSDKTKSRRVFLALVNYATQQTIVKEISVSEKVTETKLLMQLREAGKNSFRVFVFTGDGHIDSSFNRDVWVN